MMPGMAASSSIFEGIRLPSEQFQIHLLEWHVPVKETSLSAYAQQMCARITEANPILLGVSFGALLVQEMAKHIPVRKVIIVSGVKQSSELPFKMKFAKRTKVYKLLPTGLVTNLDFIAKYAFGKPVVKRLELYKKYIALQDKVYIDWSIDKIVNWSQEHPAPNLVHIHGDKDPVFPIKNIKDCIPVKGGTHTVIVHRARWFNEHLPKIILS